MQRVRHADFAQVTGAVEARIVKDVPAGDRGGNVARQRLERRIHVREARIPAGRRHLERVQAARIGWLLDEVEVAVPERLRIAEAAELASADDDVRDDHHLRMRIDEAAPLEKRRLLELAEARREAHQCCVVQALLAEQQHEMFEPGGTNARECRVVDRLRHVDAADFRADRVRKRRDVATCVHRIVSLTG